MYKVEKKIKEGIKLHILKNEKFKTNVVEVSLIIDLKKENVTENFLILSLLKKATYNYQTQKKLNEKLEELYGATLASNIYSLSNKQIINFSIEVINDLYVLEGEKLLKDTIDLIFEVILNPYIVDGKFNEEYLKLEKDRLIQIIEGRKDNKDRYALERCLEEMYDGTANVIYQYGTIKDVNEVTSEGLYSKYKELINSAKIDIYVSGDVSEEDVEDIVTSNKQIMNLKDRTETAFEMILIKDQDNIKEVFEKMDINQGKLVIGIKVKEENNYAALLYNMILGGTPTSRMFQIVREKYSLAYTASSTYVRNQQDIIIKCGIDFDKYNKTIEVIKKQMEELSKGNFTEKEIEFAKANIVSVLKMQREDQTREIAFYKTQDFYNEKQTLDENINSVVKISKEQIEKVANNVKINTIYFLKD